MSLRDTSSASHFQLHDSCASQLKSGECTLGEFRVHILPPTAIYPVVLDRQRSFSRDRRSTSGLSRSETSDPLPVRRKKMGQPPSSMSSITLELFWGKVESSNPNITQGTSGPMSFQITPPENTRPLLVFINPKSGGCQGPKLHRKFQYLLNPRQVRKVVS